MKKDSNINDVLKDLGLKPIAQRVLITLTEKGATSVADLSSLLNMPKSSIYDAVSQLVERSLVTEHLDERGRLFEVSDKDQLVRVYTEKINNLKSAHETLISFMQSHSKSYESASAPRIKFYSGIEGERQAFRDMSWHKDCKDAYLMWPMRDMIDNLGGEFLKHHSEQRLKFPVTLHSIRKHTDKSLQKEDKYKWLESSSDKFREIRYAPENMDWNMSYWIYGDKCLFASSGKERFSFIIQSRDFSSMMKLLWSKMWDSSKK